MAPSLSSLTQRDLKICDTPACHDLSERLLATVNLNVDPCSDFFQYTCGSWLKSKPVKESVTAAGILLEIEQTNLQQIIGFLNGTFEDLQKDIQTDDKSFQTHNQTEVDKKNFELIKDYYKNCLDNESRSKMGASPMFPIVAEIENSLFPITDTINPENVAKTLAQSTLYGVQSFFKFSVTQDTTRFGYNTVKFDLPFRNEKGSYRPENANYQLELVNNITNVLGAPLIENSEYKKLIEEKSQASNFTFWSQDKISEAVSNYILIELQMDPILYATYNESELSLTFDELKANSANINWDTFFTSLTPDDEFIASGSILQAHKDHISAVDKLISSLSSQALQEYFIIKTVLQNLDSLKFPEPDRFVSPDIKDTTVSGDQLQCGSETSKKFKHIVGRFFVLKAFGASKEKKKIEDMADIIHSTWIEEVPDIDWIDEPTKARLLEKIKAIEKRIAYSTTSPDARDPSAIASLYNNVITKTSYFEARSNITVHENKRLWGTLGHPVDRNEWHESHYPEAANALNNAVRNAIEIPVGFIQEPHYGSDYPQYMNYGNLGVTIAHEYIHSVDNIRIILNATGQYEEWFSEEATISYLNKTKCLIDQYSQFALLGPNNQRFPIDGSLTLSENIPDNGGLKLAYNAYRKHVKNNASDGILPGFENFTEEQLFFISHGLFTCAVGNKDKNGLLLKIDPHSPMYHRNIVPFQNSPEFAKAFNCPVGSPMNPSDKCSVW
ncbi:hypothetical protein BD770DRAFT_469954 [Pilaira anomala]|nr:hypothetical protein BD770DRAFT_469954 [Pilaira anomala]